MVNDADFHCEFKSSYLRVTNYGRKIIRCFPQCSTTGHRNNSFCGTPITVTVQLPPTLPDGQVQFWAHISPENSEDIPKLNGEVSLDLFDTNEITSLSPSNEWMKGVALQESNKDIAVVAFNSRLKGWQYGWRSHRYTSNIGHCFRVYTCVLKAESIHIHSVLKSPPFSLYSRAANSVSQHQESNAEVKVTGATKHHSLSENTTSCKKQFGVHSQAPESTNWEHVENRTLDRIHDLFEAGGEAWPRLKILLMSKGIDDEIIETLENIYERYVLMFRGDATIDICVTKWSQNPNLFNQICVDELLLWQTPSDPSVKDATYIEGYSTPSVYSEIRQAYRDKLRVSLDGVSINSLCLPMKIASEAGLIPLDPCHPPSTSIASCIYSRLYGEVAEFNPAVYSTGLSKFSSALEYLNYNRDLLQFRRKTHQVIVFSRMEYQHRCRMESLEESDILDTRIDFRGNWVNEAYAETSNVMFPGVIGKLLGEFGAIQIMTHYSKLKIRMNKLKFLATTMTECAKLDYTLDAQVHGLIPGIVPGSFESRFGMSVKDARYIACADIRGISCGSVTIYRDYNIALPASFVSENYNEFFRQHPSDSYRLLCFLDFSQDILNPDVLKVGYNDFLVPKLVEIEFTRENMSALSKEKRFLASCTGTTFLRIMDNDDEEESLSLLSIN